MLSVVCWLWAPRPGYACAYGAEHVNRLRSMVARNLDVDHELVCATDMPEGIDPRVRIVELPPETGFATHPKRPNCYRRLRAFAPDAADWLGERILSIDLDTVITGDLTPLVSRRDDFVIYGTPIAAAPYNGSMWMLRAGSRPQVWDRFDPERTPQRTQALGLIGSDQAHIVDVLGRGEATWTARDGLLGYMRDVRKANRGLLPDNARAVFFFGPHDPAKCDDDWIRENWW